MIKNLINKLLGEMRSHPLHYLALSILFFFAFFVRTYRTDMLLRFYYDQGRDAVVIKEMIETPKPVLVGPTTGLAGILRGPAFYYLLLPAYFVSSGSPIAAAIWLQIVNIFGLFVFYLVLKRFFGREASLFGLIIFAFSNYMVDLSRWLSNPSPIFTSVPVMLYSILKIRDGKNRNLWFAILALMVGVNLQFEIASELWFIPALGILAIIDKKFRPNLKEFIIGFSVFMLTLAPQVIFDIRHDGIMRKGIMANFGTNKPSFVFDTTLAMERLDQFKDIYSQVLVPRAYALTIFVAASFVFFFATSRSFRSKTWIILTVFLTPFLILLFYHGNEGNFYSYYMIGTFPLFIFLVTAVFAQFFNSSWTQILPVLLIFVFLQRNVVLVKNFLIAGVDGPEHISLGNQLQAIDWIYDDAKGEAFNTDEYVPPVIPYSYDYLLWWRGKKWNSQPKQEQVKRLYLLYEVDTELPGRLSSWLVRQASIGSIEKEAKFGGITVQRRVRIK
jgi:hypothetical protein